MPDTPAEYEYQALSDASKQIRLLSFIPGQPDDEIHCRCSIHGFDKGHTAPVYNAISYTWGSPSETSTIFVDGQALTVRQNCWYALWQARRLMAMDGAETKIPFVWIDAICINQADLAEKGSQVAMMGDVFSRASRTLVCVGCHADDSKLFFDRAPAELASHLRNWKSPAILDLMTPTETETGVQALERRKTLWSQMFGPSECMRAAVSIKAMAQRPYFHRVWIIQEVQLSEKTVLCCGASAVNLEVFLNLLTHLDFNHQLLGEKYSYPLTVLSDTWRTIVPLGKEEMNLKYLLQVYSDHQCSDWHDMVYALLGLVSDSSSCKDTGCNARNMPPRYDYSPPELFMQTIPYLRSFANDLWDCFLGAHRLLISFGMRMANEMRPYLEVRRGVEPIRPPSMEKKENRIELTQSLGYACTLLERDGDLYIPDADIVYGQRTSYSPPVKVALPCRDANTFVTAGPCPKARRILAHVDSKRSTVSASEYDSPACALITSPDVKAGDLLVGHIDEMIMGGVFYMIARKKAGTEIMEFIHHAFAVGEHGVDWRHCVTLCREAFDPKNALVGKFAVEDIMVLTYVQHNANTVEFVREHLETRVCGWQGSSYIEPGPALDEIISRGIAEEHHDGVPVDDLGFQGIAGGC